MAAKKKKFWIKDAIKNPGALRRDLGAKPGEPIKPADIKGAANGAGKKAQRAQLALTLAKFRAKKKMGK